jgi:hypothetical protein
MIFMSEREKRKEKEYDRKETDDGLGIFRGLINNREGREGEER